MTSFFSKKKKEKEKVKKMALFFMHKTEKSGVNNNGILLQGHVTANVWTSVEYIFTFQKGSTVAY